MAFFAIVAQEGLVRKNLNVVESEILRQRGHKQYYVLMLGGLKDHKP